MYISQLPAQTTPMSSLLNAQGRARRVVREQARVVKAVERYFVYDRDQPFKVGALEEKGKKE